jgi:hypothetical protein
MTIDDPHYVQYTSLYIKSVVHPTQAIQEQLLLRKKFKSVIVKNSSNFLFLYEKTCASLLRNNFRKLATN